MTNAHRSWRLVLDFFPRQWGWHFESEVVTHPQTGWRLRTTAVHVGPLIVTIQGEHSW